MFKQETQRASLDWVNELPQAIAEPKKVELTEEELIANFFLGLFPDIDDPEDLSIEISTFLEDLQIHARAKKNQQIVGFCDVFADNADRLTKDLLAAKKIIMQKVHATYKQEAADAEKIAKAFEKNK